MRKHKVIMRFKERGHGPEALLKINRTEFPGTLKKKPWAKNVYVILTGFEIAELPSEASYGRA